MWATKANPTSWRSSPLEPIRTCRDYTAIAMLRSARLFPAKTDARQDDWSRAVLAVDPSRPRLAVLRRRRRIGYRVGRPSTYIAMHTRPQKWRPLSRQAGES